MHKQPVFRFAPSPNGFLHLGHAYSAVITHTMAENSDARFIVRIEDIDTGRTREDFVETIFEDLAWLGLDWEQPVRRQSEHFPDYKQALDQLQKKKLLYPCFATRKEIAEAINKKNSPVHPLDPDGSPLYPQLHKTMSTEEIDRRINNGENYAYRIDMEAALKHVAKSNKPMTIECMDENGYIYQREARPQLWGDTVIMRKDTPTSYHLSVVVDDALQNVTHVTRGKDLEAATDLHRLLQMLLDYPAPIYHHHELLTDEDGQKLSKSRGSKSLKDLRKEGMEPAEIKKLLLNQ